ncbi:hypothetical protein MIND_00967100 [Mycena indigotica]|uniref:Zn(2)-C6 fungal-type domain-containing protein n=1 Tax=Mycena indigotica TaxID=2126181 RepID=A0A8H6SE86_9AGAR|nr:uncharacterized protein MIND_00967100 [Mycena indigotica]KAF7297337.1 hypothetical protein MIND_00967100 [Mycena indigotica]
MADDSASIDEISDDAPSAPNSAGGPSSADTSWTSRRGKARCDSCRLRNLKCDRVLPICNQCRWTPGPAGSSCTYTPLPTPAHRGVPRCDRCRESNLKCDRASPVCQYCRESNITDCRYTPKKRARLPLEQHSQAPRVPYNEGESASFMFTNISGPNSSYNRPFVNEGSSSQPDSMDVDRPMPPYPSSSAYEKQGLGPPLALLPAPSGPSNLPAQQPFISHSFPEPPRNQFRAWTHNAFAPLPNYVLRRLTTIAREDMPARETFDVALQRFRDRLEIELRETAYLAAEDYATVANCLAKGNINRLSPRIRQWALSHRVSSGSNRYNLLVIPRDATFQLSSDKEKELLHEYRAELDDQPSTSDKQDDELAFERVPVVNQIYDCLVYAHRGHASSVAAIMEIHRLGFATITWSMAEIFRWRERKIGRGMGLMKHLGLIVGHANGGYLQLLVPP